MTGKVIPVRVRSTRPARPEPETEAPVQPDQPVEDRTGESGHDGLLSDVLSIADNLERALALAQEDTPIRQGVALTHRGVLQLLRKHGLERIEARRQAFDPHWHEAIDVVSAKALGVDPGTVVQVMAPGYRRGEQLFRPARVVVAQ
jgi:molecular chaperone GrpE